MTSLLALCVVMLQRYIAKSQRAFDRNSEIARLSLIFISLTYPIGCLGEDHFDGKSGASPA